MTGMKDLFGDELYEQRRPNDEIRRRLAENAKQIGMDQVDRAADPDWQALMYQCVLQVARERPRFNSDDVFDLFDASGSTVTTHDSRAFGPVMMRAAKAGICRKADCAPVNSRRASRHAAPLSLWDSLVFGR